MNNNKQQEIKPGKKVIVRSVKGIVGRIIEQEKQKLKLTSYDCISAIQFYLIVCVAANIYKGIENIKLQMTNKQISVSQLNEQDITELNLEIIKIEEAILQAEQNTIGIYIGFSQDIQSAKQTIVKLKQLQQELAQIKTDSLMTLTAVSDKAVEKLRISELEENLNNLRNNPNPPTHANNQAIPQVPSPLFPNNPYVSPPNILAPQNNLPPLNNYQPTGNLSQPGLNVPPLVFSPYNQQNIISPPVTPRFNFYLGFNQQNYQTPTQDYVFTPSTPNQQNPMSPWPNYYSLNPRFTPLFYQPLPIVPNMGITIEQNNNSPAEKPIDTHQDEQTDSNYSNSEGNSSEEKSARLSRTSTDNSISSDNAATQQAKQELTRQIMAIFKTFNTSLKERTKNLEESSNKRRSRTFFKTEKTDVKLKAYDKKNAIDAVISNIETLITVPLNFEQFIDNLINTPNIGDALDLVIFDTSRHNQDLYAYGNAGLKQACFWHLGSDLTQMVQAKFTGNSQSTREQEYLNLQKRIVSLITTYKENCENTLEAESFYVL